MRNTSRDYSKKLLAIRKAEGMTQKKFSEIIGVSLGTVQKYETGQQPARSEIMERILNVKHFEKYLMWLTINKTAPESGQIAPSFVDDLVKEISVDSANMESKSSTIKTSSQKPAIQDIVNSISNLDDDEVKQLAKLISRRGSMFLLKLLDPKNQALLGLTGVKKLAAWQLEAMSDERAREILSEIEADMESNTKIGEKRKVG